MSRQRILVVEDDGTLANMYRLALCLAGFEVDVVGDGLSALEDIDDARPDLVVLDWNLPQLPGEAVLTEVASTPDTCSIPVIVLGGADTPDRVDAATAVLRKPLDAGELVAAVSQQLQERSPLAH